MFSVVTNVVNYFVTIIQWFFLATSFLGQIIVTILTTIYSFVLRSTENIILFFRIIYEDNITIFTEELPKVTYEFVDFFVTNWLQVQNYFHAICYYAINNVKVTIGTMKWLLKEFLLFASDIVFLLKKTFIFLGETLWLVLTFVPIQLPQLLEEIWKTLRNCVYYYAFEAYKNLLKCTNFLTDVPLQSFVGLITTMIIVRLCVHFRDDLRSVLSSLYWIIIRKVLYFCYVLYNYFNDYDTRLIAQMFRGQQLAQREDAVETNNQDLLDAADSLCIICQERPKCVLTLPCRHVCLCTECCMRLYGYQRTCPICRTFIYHSVTVYL